MEDHTFEDIKKDNGEKKPSYDDSITNSLKLTLVIHGEGEGQVQTYEVDDEALIEDIDHNDAGEQHPQVAPATTLVLRRSSRDY